MSEFEVSAIYKIVTLLVGAGIMFLGYRLFRTGVFDRAGELKAAWGDNHLELKQAAPGSFFAILGAVVLVISVSKGLTFERVGATSDERPNKLVIDHSSLLETNPVVELVESMLDGDDLDDGQKEKVREWLEYQRIGIRAERPLNSTDPTGRYLDDDRPIT